MANIIMRLLEKLSKYAAYTQSRTISAARSRNPEIGPLINGILAFVLVKP